MANTYDTGDKVDIDTSTVFQDSNGNPFDPDVVTFTVKDSSGTSTSYVLADDEVVKNGTGDFTCTVNADLPGWWYYRVEGVQNDGDYRGADEGSFYVKRTRV